MYALVDVNNMYVSCERVFRPALNGRPVVVLSSGDGVVVARSNEAKDLGIKMAQPFFQVRHLQREAGLVALSANFELYGDMSSRMMALVGAYAPRQEVYSIDESFLSFEGVRSDLSAACRDMRAKVLQWTGLPTSVGLGPTKTLAKLANHIAKMADRRRGGYPQALAQVCNFAELGPAQLDALFASTEVGDVWGIGRKISARLNEAGIRTVQQLVRSDVRTLRKQFSVMLEKTVLELQGTSCIDVEDEPAAQQQIMCSRSFSTPVTQLPGLIDLVSQFASRVAEKARQQQAAAGAVQVFISTSPYRKNDRQHSPSVTMPFVRPINDTTQVIATAVRALQAMYRPGFNYVRAGVMVVDLAPQDQQQAELDLFGPASAGAAPAAAARDRSQLMSTIDELNRRFGRGAVSIASAAQQSTAPAQVGKQEHRSARSTTRLDEVPTVRC